MPAKRAPISAADYAVGADVVEEIRRATGSTRQITRRYGISKSHVAFLRRPSPPL